MQCLKLFMRSFEISKGLWKPTAFSKYIYASNDYQKKDFHSSSPSCNIGDCRKWMRHNKTMWPPQSPEEEPRLAYVCHMKPNIHYSYKKMWYVACLVRGMSVDEAVKQLSFVIKKGATAVKETILEAQQIAVEKHNVEFKSNLWVAESFISKGRVIKGLRRHARKRPGEIRYTFCHYYVRLEEGRPPPSKEHYYAHTQPIHTQQYMLDKWLTQIRSRKITNSL